MRNKPIRSCDLVRRIWCSSRASCCATPISRYGPRASWRLMSIGPRSISGHVRVRWRPRARCAERAAHNERQRAPATGQHAVNQYRRTRVQTVRSTALLPTHRLVRLRLLFLAAAFITAALARPSNLSAQTDVIRGRITGPDSLPVERARITVTSLSGNVSRTAQTDKNGRFTVAFPGDEGDYFVNVAALGFPSKPFEGKRTGDQEILVADARLQRVATQLDAGKVQADRQKASRNDNMPDVSGSERAINQNAVSAS